MNDQAQAPQEEAPKTNDKEFNFRQLEAKYERQLAQERAARQEAERLAQEALAVKQQQLNDDDDDDAEPYIDKKKLKKEQARFGQQIKQETQSEIQKAVNMALQEERKNNWIRQNPDFYDTLQKHAEKIVQKDPELAETILQMPDSFERQKLVYKNIKALGLDKPEVKQPAIQDKIDANRRSPYYQPSGIAAAPYSQMGDFSDVGKKNAYQKMMELKSRMRM